MLLSRQNFTLAALALLLLGSSASAQRNFRPLVYSAPVNPNPMIAPGVFLKQYAYNTAVLGQALGQVPPYLLGGGYNPGPIGYGAGVGLPISPYAAANPYALSTMGSYNPYLGSAGLGGTGMLSNSPYSLSTAGGGVGSSPTSYLGYGGYGAYNPSPYGGAAQGQAALTAATGDYLKSVQQARITREQSRQMALDTIKRRIELARWIESTRPTANQLRENQMAEELEHIRKDANDIEVNNAKALNVLLRSIQKAGQQVNRGPNVAVPEDNLKHINVAGSGANGNVGMLKDISKLTWPEGLQDAGFEEARKRLTRNLVQAVTILKDKDPVPATTLKDIRADYKTLNDKLNDSADDIPPSLYIESRRFLNQINQAVRALADPNAEKFFNNTWTAKGKNVAELVSHMSRQGLTFAPAAPGDEAAYKALYLAMRQFEAGLEMAKK